VVRFDGDMVLDYDETLFRINDARDRIIKVIQDVFTETGETDIKGVLIFKESDKFMYIENPSIDADLKLKETLKTFLNIA
jgi:hypothetical protein